MEVSEDCVSASVFGTEEYEVKISLINGEVSDMYCSCPYAEDGNNCKHMAAVLYEWSSDMPDETVAEAGNTELFGSVYTNEGYMKKREAVEKLLTAADTDVLASFLTDILMDNEKLLVRFHNIVNGQATEEDVKIYEKQVDAVVNSHLGRERFIDYYDADDFISELEDFIDEDVRRMIDNADYYCAFELLNYIFATIGNVDMDDSDSGTGMLANRIYQLWIELLSKVTAQDNEEKLFDRLLDFVLQSNGLYALQEYESVLKKDYPEQLLLKYETEVNKLATHISDRKNYEQLVSLLRQMQKIKGGDRIVEEISEQWRMKYRNRRATEGSCLSSSLKASLRLL